MSTELNKALVRRYREAHTMKNLTLLDKILAADIKSHSDMQELPNGLQGGKMAHQTFLAAMGAPSTGKKVTFSGMSVFRIANGKIVEHWGANDALGTRQKNGAKEELYEEGSTSTRHPTSPHFRNAPHSTCVHYLLSKCAACSYACYRHPPPKSTIAFCLFESTCVQKSRRAKCGENEIWEEDTEACP